MLFELEVDGCKDVLDALAVGTDRFAVAIADELDAVAVVGDGAETLQRVRSDTRDRALNALRQLIDEVDQGRFPGLYLVITGTPGFDLAALCEVGHRVRDLYAERADAEERSRTHVDDIDLVL